MNIADIGLTYLGYQHAADADRARQQQEEDRQYQLEQRRRDEEQAIARQEEFRRQQAFLQETRSLVPTYLAGGANGIAAQPAQPAVQLDPRQQEGGDIPMPAVGATPARDNIEGMYHALQEVALKHGQLDTAEALRKRYAAAKQEGVLDFVAAARQGAPDDVLLQEFNKSGNVKLKAIRKVAPDEWAGMTTDDKPVSLNVNRLLESSLAPKELLAHLDKGTALEEKMRQTQLTTDAKNQATAATLDAKRERLKADEDVKAARAERDRAYAGLADSRAGAVDSGGGTGRPRTQGEMNQLSAKLRTFAVDALSQPDPDNPGKTILPDRRDVVQLSSMAAEIARRDSSLTAPEAVFAAKGKMAELQQIRDDAVEQATTEAQKIFKDPKDRAKYVKSRSDGLTRMRTSFRNDNAGGAAFRDDPLKQSGGDGNAGESDAKPASQYQSAEDVRAAFRSGRLSREQAKAALKSFGFQ